MPESITSKSGENSTIFLVPKIINSIVTKTNITVLQSTANAMKTLFNKIPSLNVPDLNII